MSRLSFIFTEDSFRVDKPEEDCGEQEELKSEVKDRSPESINDGEETSPSKRLLNHLRYEKGSEIMIPLSHIGVEKMREKCPHFSEWVSRIEAIV